MDCKKALVEAEGDQDKAIVLLRQKGQAVAEKKRAREAGEGIIAQYVHADDKKGAMLELNCETDFVARTTEFQTLAHDLTLHIAFAAPLYTSRDEVPDAAIEAEKAVYRAQALEEGKPEHIIDRIVEGKLEKYFKTVCLMEQPFVKDEDRPVEEILKDQIARLGENIVVRRFVRYELGESVE
jgi:elongation factor Ts